MSEMNEPRRGRPNTYILPDGITPRELTRLRTQDEMCNAALGLLPASLDLTPLYRILDIGCGTGRWLIEMARAYPTLTKLIGIDISEPVLRQARELAQFYEVHDRVEFYPMDALQALRFPDSYFDLLHQRFGSSYLRVWDWRQVTQEYRRVLRPGGVLCLTEGDITVDSTSQAEMRFHRLLHNAFYQSNHLFDPQKPGITGELAPLLTQTGLKHVQALSHTVDYFPHTPVGQYYCENLCLSLETLVPFFRKWGQLPTDYETLCQQIVQDTRQSDFATSAHFITAWGEK